MVQEIVEGRAKVDVFLQEKISKELPVFFNPVMKLNRDISILLLDSIKDGDIQAALPLAASGIRGIRMLLELPLYKVKSITFNDYSEKAIASIKKNLEKNTLEDDPRVILSREDANLFLQNSTGFDYIDIDPFGSPNPFLETAITRLSRGGILAVTATDTSALTGTYPKSTARKYWAKPLKNEFMHETGIRILIRKVQLIGAALDKALTPIFSYSKDHYYRIFFKCEKGKQKVDAILLGHGYLLYCRHCLERQAVSSALNDCLCRNCKGPLEYAGSMWLGSLWDTSLAEIMLEKCRKDFFDEAGFLEFISDESKLDAPFYHEIHEVSSVYKVNDLPKMDRILDYLRIKGYSCSRTHFSGSGIRTDAGIKELVAAIN